MICWLLSCDVYMLLTVWTSCKLHLHISSLVFFSKTSWCTVQNSLITGLNHINQCNKYVCTAMYHIRVKYQLKIIFPVFESLEILFPQSYCSIVSFWDKWFRPVLPDTATPSRSHLAYAAIRKQFFKVSVGKCLVVLLTTCYCIHWQALLVVVPCWHFATWHFATMMWNKPLSSHRVS